ncbi:MAG TPA: AAA family ATPase, partial [Rubrivivax sp.]|nr:AAA family ATPase [Rubrivivax sp.]
MPADTLLLERDDLLAQLSAQWSQASTHSGRLVLVSGEAGIGKTSLLRAFAQPLARNSPQAPVWRGACEALQTPRPLGALDDIAQQAGGALKVLLDAGQRRDRIFVAFFELLRSRPVLVVLEDLHWADGATLDLLLYIGRRIEQTNSLLVASYRTDELAPGHPLRAVLGDLATGRPLQLTPLPLSRDAVHLLCQASGADALELHERTGGNPFFVTEVLAAPASQVPSTVQDAVLARAGRLTPSARAVLDAAAIAGPRVEPWVLEALAAAESAAIEEGLATGVLCVDGGAITFRHELARQAVLCAMTPTRAMSLHRMAQRALLAKALPHATARLALHAEGAGDAEAVRRWAPVAAREAAARGAHQQAAQHWARALAHTEDEAERAALLDAQAHELRACGRFEEAVSTRQQAARAWRLQGQARAAIRSFTELCKLHLLASRIPLAEAALEAARSLLPADTAGYRVERAWTDLCEANLRRHTLDHAAALALAQPVLELAEQQGDRPLQLETLKTVGAALLGCGRGDEGIAHLERGFAIAEAMGADLWAAMMLSDLAHGCAGLLRLDDTERHLQRGVEWCADRDLDAPRLFQVALRAWLHLLRGRWDEAEADAQAVIRSPRAMTIARVRAYTVLGRLQARRGDPGASASLGQAA